MSGPLSVPLTCAAFFVESKSLKALAVCPDAPILRTATVTTTRKGAS
jgi:hypothetical protein